MIQTVFSCLNLCTHLLGEVRRGDIIHVVALGHVLMHEHVTFCSKTQLHVGKIHLAHKTTINFVAFFHLVGYPDVAAPLPSNIISLSLIK